MNQISLRYEDLSTKSSKTSGRKIFDKQVIGKIQRTKHTYFDALLAKPCPNKVLLFILSWVGILKNVAVSTVEFCLFGSWKESLPIAIYTPYLCKWAGHGNVIILSKKEHRIIHWTVLGSSKLNCTKRK